MAGEIHKWGRSMKYSATVEIGKHPFSKGRKAGGYPFDGAVESLDIYPPTQDAPSKDHIESTAGVDMDSWSAPVSSLRVSF
jgi:hypothetical protein